jgi:hypothetical protein
MRWIRIAGALAGLALTAAACGPAAKAGPQGTPSREDQQLAFVKCMRDHGVEVESSSEDGNFSISIGGPAGGVKGSEVQGDDKTSEAMEACKDKMPRFGSDLSPEERAKLDDALLEFAKCMREHGIDMPDPSEGGFVQIQKGSGQSTNASGPDPEDPEFKAAEKACEDKLPNKGKGGKTRITREAP